MVDFNYFLNRKYMNLQDQTKIAQQNADTGAMTGAAAARLDNTRATLLPNESKATIAKMGAETNLIGEQASIVRPESVARIANMNADTALTKTNRDVTIRQDLTPFGQNFGSGLGGFLQQLTGGGAAAGARFQLPPIVSDRQRRDPARFMRGMSGNPSAADLDYSNGF